MPAKNKARSKPGKIQETPVEAYKPFQPDSGQVAIPDEETSIAPPPPLPAKPAPSPNPFTGQRSFEPQPRAGILEPKIEETDNEVPLEQNNKRIYIIGIAAFLVVVMVVGALLYARTKITGEEAEKPGEEVVEVVEQTPEIVSTPEPASESMSREEISLEILNGSGIAGKAGDTAEIFEKLGYEVVSTGNSKRIEGNKLYISDSVEEDVLTNLLEDVKKELGIESVTEKVENLETTARIVIGE